MSKLRNVLEDPLGQEVCLKDVLEAFIGCSKRMSALEYKNSAWALREAKKALREAEKVMLEFKRRIKVDITEEVIEALSKIDKRVVPDNFKKNEEYFGD